MFCSKIALNPGNPKVTLSTYVLEDSLQYHTGLMRPAVLVLPGGGYTFISDREGDMIALAFAARGYHAFVLRYSVGAAAHVPAPVLEGFSAIALIREKAKEWHIDDKKIAVCGFSAGGHLASGLMTMWDDEKILQSLGARPEEIRPDAGILCYALLKLPYCLPPVNTGMRPSDRALLEAKLEQEALEPQHPDWKKYIFEKDSALWIDTAAIAYLNCFGTVHLGKELLNSYNTVLQVKEDTPPAFLWCTTPDDIVPATDSAAFATAMLQKGRPVELHIFGSGEHGLSLAKEVTGSKDDLHPAGKWFELALTWLKETFQEKSGNKPSPFYDGSMQGLQPSLPEGNEKPDRYYMNIYKDRAGMFRHSPFILEQALIRHVMNGNEREALKTLGLINEQGEKAILAREPLRSAKNSMICSCAFLTRAAIQAGVSDEEAFALSDASIQHIETLKEEETVLSYEAVMLLQFIRLVKKRDSKSYSAPVRKALHYIDSNLEKAFHLNAVAEYTQVHPNYLCKRFKQETGITVAGYAISRKIHEAAYFVQHTPYSIAEIATLYGFSSQSHFTKDFKRVLGVSPGEYRKNSMNP